MIIELDKEYKNYTQVEFMNIIKKYPLVPFYVSGNNNLKSGVIYRWNIDSLETQTDKSNWQSTHLLIEEESNNGINFIVHKFLYLIYADRIADKVLVCLKDKE